MNDLNYILYKKIFNNLYISNLIFNYVSIINYNIFKENFKDEIKQLKKKENDQYFKESLNQLKNEKIFKLNNIPYQIIFRFNLIELFKDNLKLNKKYIKKENEIYDLIHIEVLEFLKKNQNQQEQPLHQQQQQQQHHQQEKVEELIKEKENTIIEGFKKFYQLNKELFLKKTEKDINININAISSIKYGDFFQLLVRYDQIELLNYVYQDQKELILREKEFFNQYLNGDNRYKILNITNLPFSIYFNKNLIESTLIFSSIEIIKFFIEVLEINYFIYFKNNIYGILIKSNRIEILNYFLNQSLSSSSSSLSLSSSSSSSSSSITSVSGSIDFIPILEFKYFLNLNNYSIFKKLIRVGYNIKFKFDILFLNLENLNNNIYNNSNNNNNIINQIDNIKIIFYGCFLETKDLNWLVLIKFLKYLIKFNNDNNNNNNKITFNLLKSITLQINNKQIEQNKIKSIFNQLKYSISNNSNINNLIENLNINYNQFNLEKEINKIYLFYFFKKYSIKLYYLNLINFSSNYQDYQLLKKELKELKYFIDKEIVIISTIKELIYLKIYRDVDYLLYSFFKENDNIILNINSEHDKLIWNPHLEFLDSSVSKNQNLQSSLLSLLNSFKQYNDSLFNKLFIKSLSIKQLNFVLIDKFIIILKEYYNQNQNLYHKYINAYEFDNLISIDNFNYIYKNYKFLFIKWERCSKLIN